MGGTGGAGPASSTDLQVQPRRLRAERSSTEVVLMRQWLVAALHKYSYISAPAQTSDESWSYMFFHVLAIDSRTARVKTFRSPDDDPDESDHLLSVTVQPLERWGEGDLQGAQASPGVEVEVYGFVEPYAMDLLGACGRGIDNREHWWVWEAEESEVSGCTALRSPARLCPKMPLGHPKAPPLVLMDALREKGWQQVQNKVMHTLGGLVFDGRSVASRRAYLQSLLALEELTAAGIPGFESGHPNMYYVALMRTRRVPDPKTPAEELKRLLANESGDVLQLAILDQLARPSAAPALQGGLKRRAAEALPDEDSSIAGDASSGDGDQGSGGVDAAGPVALPGDDEIAGDDAVASAGDLPPQPWPLSIEGQTVTRVKGRVDAHWSYHDRLSVRCSNPLHPNCTRSRSTEMDRQVLGHRAAEAFLGVWLSRSNVPAQEHRKFKPSRDEMRAYLASH